MANTYAQLHIQFVFAVKYRAALVAKEWKDEFHKYINGIFQKNEHKMLQVNSMPDHIHILIGMWPTQSISSLVQNIKTESSKWIKDKKILRRSLRLAGRIRCIFLFKKPCAGCDSLHSKPGSSS
jgi:putative transposase